MALSEDWRCLASIVLYYIISISLLLAQGDKTVPEITEL